MVDSPKESSASKRLFLSPAVGQGREVPDDALRDGHDFPHAAGRARVQVQHAARDGGRVLRARTGLHVTESMKALAVTFQGSRYRKSGS